jgi:hypothetical protein
MFQPMGPNFLLSCTMAWKRQKEKRSFLYWLGLAQSLKVLLSRLA